MQVVTTHMEFDSRALLSSGRKDIASRWVIACRNGRDDGDDKQQAGSRTRHHLCGLWSMVYGLWTINAQ